MFGGGRALSILVNKWDLALESFRKDPSSRIRRRKGFPKKLSESIRKELYFLPDSPVSFVSAMTGYSIEGFLQVAQDLNARMDKTLSTSALNKLIGDMWSIVRRPKSKASASKSFMPSKWKIVLFA